MGILFCYFYGDDLFLVDEKILEVVFCYKVFLEFLWLDILLW